MLAELCRTGVVRGQRHPSTCLLVRTGHLAGPTRTREQFRCLRNRRIGPMRNVGRTHGIERHHHLERLTYTVEIALVNTVLNSWNRRLERPISQVIILDANPP